jgi:hypothetical protein
MIIQKENGGIANMVCGVLTKTKSVLFSPLDTSFPVYPSIAETRFAFREFPLPVLFLG